ncbi:MAG: hypothetical protein EA419_01015 [Wenzhouxiangella sp.]|nr:MAG: hypothetical protein EA419_01015 [Wenzhouxiangella sp.]
MKKLFLILAALLVVTLAAVLAPALLDDPGHVTIDAGPWRVEMSMLVLVGLVIAAWIAVTLVIAIFRLPGRTVRRARQARSQRQLENGLLALVEGDWQQAEKHLGKALAQRGSTAGYLAAARAAQGQSEPGRRDDWLELADARYGRRHRVAGLARARFLLDEGRPEEAIDQLEELHLRKPRHPGVLRLLLQAYQDAGRWRDLRLLTPALHKADITDRQRTDELAVLAGVRELEQAAEPEQLESVWRSFPRRLRRSRDLVMAHARRAAEMGRSALAGARLKKLLAEKPDREALRLYALVDSRDRPGRIADCQGWLRERPDDDGLHLALGMMYLDDRDYEQARKHLEKSLAARSDGEAYALLGRILDRSGRLEAAAQCYRNALRLKSGRSAESLPPPAESEPDSPAAGT